MPLTITATLVDSQNKPLPNIDAQVCTFATAGTPRVLGTGRSGTDGKLSFSCAWTPTADYQPRIQLQLKRGTAFVEASENPVTFTSAACDFGTVAFDLSARLTLPRVSMLAVTVAEADELRLRVATLDKTRLDLEVQLKARDSQLASKDAELQSRNAELKRKDEKLAQLEQSEAPEASIEDLASTTAQQLQTTQNRLRMERADFQLGKVSLQLKVLPGRSGGSVALPRMRDIEKVTANGLGLLSLDFHPDTPPRTQTSRPTVPRVLGYTEAMARRKLADQRLGVEISSQLVTQASDEGRVVFQMPEPEAQADEGSTVLIALGKKG